MSRPQFDPSAYAAQLEDKKSRLAGLLAPFAAPAPEIFESPREHYRLRAEFRLWRETGNEKRHYAMFEQGDKHTPILIEDFPIAIRRINEGMFDPQMVEDFIGPLDFDEHLLDDSFYSQEAC